MVQILAQRELESDRCVDNLHTDKLNRVSLLHRECEIATHGKIFLWCRGVAYPKF